MPGVSADAIRAQSISTSGAGKGASKELSGAARGYKATRRVPRYCGVGTQRIGHQCVFVLALEMGVFALEKGRGQPGGDKERMSGFRGQ